jgi:ABC-type branched-subunit amino acid transport system permease subunit
LKEIGQAGDLVPFAGVAGVLFAYFNRLISPFYLGVGTSFLPMCMVIIGGSGTLIGPIVGTIGVLIVLTLITVLPVEVFAVPANICLPIT